MSVESKSVLIAAGQVAAVMCVMYVFLFFLGKNVEPKIIVKKETEYVYKTDSLDRVNAKLATKVDSLESELTKLSAQFQVKKKAIQAKTTDETVAYFLDRTENNDQSKEVSVIPVGNIRSANQLFNELDYTRAKVELMSVQGNYQLQKMEVIEAKETACIELVQVYRDKTKKRRVKWWHLVLSGFGVGLIVR